jgi:membrane associated rhomboid family serine protease
MWLVTFINLVLLGGRWLTLGVRAHDPSGLWPNLLFAPFLHVGLAHLFSNTVPFLVLGGMVALRSLSGFVIVTLVGVLGSGLGAWLLGPTGSVHVGASGLVFTYLGWLIARAFRERSLVAIVLGVVAALLYGGVLWGLSPFQTGISWEGHFGGLLAGVAVAQVGARRRQSSVDRMAA